MNIRPAPQVDDVNLQNWLRELRTVLTTQPMNARTPSSTTDRGTRGELAFDGTYLYVCIDKDTWGRLLLDLVF